MLHDTLFADKNTTSNTKLAKNIKSTSNRTNQPKSIKRAKPNLSYQKLQNLTYQPNQTKPNTYHSKKRKHQNGIHETNWQIHTISVDRSKK